MRRPQGGLDAADGSGTIEREEDTAQTELPQLSQARPGAPGRKAVARRGARCGGAQPEADEAPDDQPEPGERGA